MNKQSKIYIAGHTGLVGSALERALRAQGYTNLLVRSRNELDLMDTSAVNAFFKSERPEYVFLAAAKVGGIYANNTYPVDFLYQNLMIELNVIHAAYHHSVKTLLFLGSSCIYPKTCPQPIQEDYLLTGSLEPTNEAYAIAKISGIKLCQSYNKQYHTQYFSVMPTNLYGQNDNFDLQTSHVLPALLLKCHQAKLRGDASFAVWGDGTPRREFLHVDDLAQACLFLITLSHQDLDIINIGYGDDVTIIELAHLIKELIGYTGEIVFDKTKPNGMPKKLLDSRKINNLGWRPEITLTEGIKKTYAWCLAHSPEFKIS